MDQDMPSDNTMDSITSDSLNLLGSEVIIQEVTEEPEIPDDQALIQEETDEIQFKEEPDLQENSESASHPYLAIGIQLIRDHEWIKALPYLSKVIDSDEEAPLGWLYLGMIHIHLSNFEQAREYLQKAFSFERTRSISLYYLAFGEYRKSDFQKALTYLEQIPAGDIKNEKKLFLKGLCHFKLRQYQSAIQEFHELLISDPDHKRTLFLITYSQLLSNFPEEALKNVDHLLELDDRFVHAWELKSRILIKLERYSEALFSTKRLLWLKPKAYAGLWISCFHC
jgi:tetratricopeptide (TPR) repeat protein